MAECMLIAVGAALVNNVVLSQFLGLCPFLGVSKKTDTAAGMGAAVIFVIMIASAVTYGVYYAILTPLNLEYLQTIVFILVIAALVQLVEMILKKFIKPLYEAKEKIELVIDIRKKKLQEPDKLSISETKDILDQFADIDNLNHNLKRELVQSLIKRIEILPEPDSIKIYWKFV